MIQFFDRTDLRVSDEPLAYERKNRTLIDAYWTKLLERKPRMWNGPFFLFSAVSLDGGVLSATAHRTDFATFLHWRSGDRKSGVVHITGTSLPVTADGALFAVRMADHTANGGAVYFPAGSLDKRDIVAGQFDLTSNIARELAEETGLDFSCGLIDYGFIIASTGGCIHVARRNRVPFPFVEAERRLREHQERTGDDEIASAVAIRKDDDSRNLLKPYARMLADWQFDNCA